MKTRFRSVAILLSMLLASSAVAGRDSDVTHFIDDAGDRMPLQTMVPMYPQRALTDRIEGEVQVCFDVDREGRTSRIAVRRSSNRVFEKPAILAIRGSTYAPLVQGKVLSGIKTCRTFRFLLDPVAIDMPSEESADVEP